jgi:hypothetical protein
MVYEIRAEFILRNSALIFYISLNKSRVRVACSEKVELLAIKQLIITLVKSIALEILTNSGTNEI